MTQYREKALNILAMLKIVIGERRTIRRRVLCN